MATYQELADLSNDPNWGGLLDKITVAVAVKAESIIGEATPAASLIDWAKGALGNPRASAKEIVFYVIAANKSATTAQITSASDTAIQSNVDTAVDALYGS